MAGRAEAAPREQADPVSLALDYMIKVSDLVEECKEHVDKERKEDNKDDNKEKPKVEGEGIERRARDLPGLIASAGLVPALTFYMAKADEQIYINIYDYLSDKKELKDLIPKCLSDDKSKPGSLLKEIKDDGYAITLALAVKGLEKLAPEHLKDSGASGSKGEASSYKSLAEILKSLRENGKEIIAERILLDYLIEVKKLAEAFYGGKARE